MYKHISRNNLDTARVGLACVLASAALLGCGDDASDDANAADASPDPICVADPDLTIEGTATAHAENEFRNAFDPSDPTIYDPSDADALPGPVMVDGWGDRNSAAHGTLAVFPPGFAAPPHTHTDDYHGVVLRGEMSNPFGTDLSVFLDDDDSNNHGLTTLTAGSYWYVPAGSQHTTTCVGPDLCWFYFYSQAAFDFSPIVDENGELADGVTLEPPHPDSVLLQRSDLKFAGESGSFVQFAPADGDMSTGMHGTFGLFSAGAASPAHIHGAEYYGVVVSGDISNPFNLEAESARLTTGGFWSVPADAVHVTECAAGNDCLFFFHSQAAFDFEPLCEA